MLIMVSSWKELTYAWYWRVTFPFDEESISWLRFYKLKHCFHFVPIFYIVPIFVPIYVPIFVPIFVSILFPMFPVIVPNVPLLFHVSILFPCSVFQCSQFFHVPILSCSYWYYYLVWTKNIKKKCTNQLNQQSIIF